jgi:PHD/YefM family antitoxin component YafN of YafNO toxin-antitoxin module
MSDIKKAIEEMDLPLKVERHNGKEKLVFDSSDKWAILRLLDDDYLQSIMTGEKYEVNSKRTR